MTHPDAVEHADPVEPRDRADGAGPGTALDGPDTSVARLAGRRRDRWYPQAHIAARAGWINDPNGLVHFGGRYHVFFQHNPYGAEWGHMHWGHVSSADLVTWRHEPIAMAPELEAEAGGVFSGSAVVAPDAAGRPTLAVFYTGHGRPGSAHEGAEDGGPRPDGRAAARQVQCLATSADGAAFTKRGVVIEGPRVMTDFRDPKVWRSENRWYMVVGAGTPDAHAEVWLYSCDAATVEGMADWRFERVLHRDPEPGVYMAECPDFFPLTRPDGRRRWVLVYSAMSSRHPSASRYVVGAWAPGRPFEAGRPRPCDDGPSYYAPQTMRASDGRRVVLGWMPGPGGPGSALPQPAADDGWCGQLTVPRALALGDDDTLRAAPVRELEALRTATRNLGALVLEPGRRVRLAEDLPVGEVEVEIDTVSSTARRVRLVVDSTPDGGSVGIDVDLMSGRAGLAGRGAPDAGRGGGSAPGPTTAGEACGDAADRLRLRVLLDRGSVEVFCDDGRQAISATVFPAAGPRAVELGVDRGTAAIARARTHRISPIFR